MDWGQHISGISSRAAGTLGFLRGGLAFAPWGAGGGCVRGFGSAWTRVCGAHFEPLLRASDWSGGEGSGAAARWACGGWRDTSGVGGMLDELEWPSLEARRDRSSLLLFHKIHSGAVSMEGDGCLAPARGLGSTRSSHSAQYCRYQTYSDALKNSFSPGLYHSGIVFLLRRSIPRLLRSLGHSSFS